MQTSYFLGGSTPNGYVTDFWRENAKMYGYFLIGGPGTGKSTLMKIIAAAFQDEHVSVYHCASDPNSLDAVVLEERCIYIADATAPHEHGVTLPYISGQTVDLAALLDASLIADYSTEAEKFQSENQKAHQHAKQCMKTLSALTEIIRNIGKEALISDKIEMYADRLAKRLFSRELTEHSVYNQSFRQLSAFTPQGRITYIPNHARILCLQDDWRYASEILMQKLANYAAKRAISMEISKDLLQSDYPIQHLYFPALQLILISGKQIDASESENTATIRLSRFYDVEQIRKHRNLAKFCIKTVKDSESQVTQYLNEALEWHNQLESVYRRGQQINRLNSLTDQIILQIKKRSAAQF